MTPRRSATFILLCVIGLLGCNQHSTPVANANGATALENIPQADPHTFGKVDVHAWKNPYLIVNPRGVVMLDVADHEEKQFKPEELASALARLPQSAWPYGRVIAVTVDEKNASEDEKIDLRKNRALISGTLKDLQIYVNWIPSA
jgi:hypothetical protein